MANVRPEGAASGRDQAVESRLDYGRIASVYLVFGLLSLFTAWAFSWQSQKLFFGPAKSPVNVAATDEPQDAGEQVPTQSFGLIGPFSVTRANQVVRFRVAADVQVNKWSFVEAELLDAEKDYLLSFGQELWHETGTDSDGYWDEADEVYEMKLTVPAPGQYYLNIKTQGPVPPRYVTVAISRIHGSSIPHLIFGTLTLLIGIVLNEIANRTIFRIARRVL